MGKRNPKSQKNAKLVFDDTERREYLTGKCAVMCLLRLLSCTCLFFRYRIFKEEAGTKKEG